MDITKAICAAVMTIWFLAVTFFIRTDTFDRCLAKAIFALLTCVCAFALLWHLGFFKAMGG